MNHQINLMAYVLGSIRFSTTRTWA